MSTVNNNKPIQLGTMNGWDMDNPPIEYANHLENCGNEYIYTFCLGKPGDTEKRTGRKYNVTVTKRGNCYNNHYCHDCGISYNIDSSG